MEDIAKGVVIGILIVGLAFAAAVALLFASLLYG
jgi:hypothetical protein